jgi:hypothetical protein
LELQILCKGEVDESNSLRNHSELKRKQWMQR